MILVCVEEIFVSQGKVCGVWLVDGCEFMVCVVIVGCYFKVVLEMVSVGEMLSNLLICIVMVLVNVRGLGLFKVDLVFDGQIFVFCFEVVRGDGVDLCKVCLMIGMEEVVLENFVVSVCGEVLWLLYIIMVVFNLVDFLQLLLGQDVFYIYLLVMLVVLCEGWDVYRE